MFWPALEPANTSSCVLPAVSVEYVARATSTPPLVDTLPTTVIRLVWMQSAAVRPSCGVQGFTPVVLHESGLFSPATPRPSTSTKFVSFGLPTYACGVTPSPTYPTGGRLAGSASA